MNTMTTDQQSDEALWEAVREGDARAFEQIVERHQSLVCGVAYNACGDLALSEDLAQETFWAAWRQRDSLIDSGRLKAWLRGIARNLGANALRRSAAGRPTTSIGQADDLPADAPDPAEAVMSREEESLLWTMLEQLPPTYREPLILFYRQDQSIAEVAACLDLTSDTVKQRLSRGRAMLRDRVADQVEAGLRRSRPGRAFTTGVMAGLSISAAGAKSAAAAGTSVTAGAVAKGAFATGAMGGFLGSLIGVLGGWLGAWLPAQMAPTRRERDLYLQAGRRMLIASLVLLGVILLLIRTLAGTTNYLVGWGLTMILFQAYVFFESIRISRAVKAIRQSATVASDLNETAVRRGALSLSAKIRGRVYQSPIRPLGLPLLDVQVVDPDLHGAGGATQAPRIARGWIAIGDDARGILLAVGSKARGLVAIGGMALGVLSVGGAAVGIVAIGGLGVGVFGIAGLAVGVFAFGGGAIGWQAGGGFALGWDLAIGGGAIAWNTAVGGLAIAHDPVTRDLAGLNQPFARLFRWSLAHPGWVQFGLIVFAVVVPVLSTLLMYRRNRESGFKVAPLLAPVLLLLIPWGLKAEAPPGVVRFTLENGLTVVARPISGAKQTALVVLFNVGGDHDPEGASGLAHIVEHVYVTAAAGEIPARSAVDFSRHYPAGCNAQTGDRYTAVATVFAADQLDSELKEAAARMADLTITEADLDRERPRLLDEVANMFDRIPALGAVNHAREMVRPTPLGGRRGGLPAQVQTLTLDEVRDHWKRYYKPRNTVLVAAGAIDPARFRKAVTNHFERIPGGEPAPKPAKPGTALLGRNREIASAPLRPGSTATACVALTPAAPGSDLYAPYLVLVARLVKASAARGGGPAPFSVHTPLLDDPDLLAITAASRPGESVEQAGVRLGARLDEVLESELSPDEVAMVEPMFGFFLGTVEFPDRAVAANPYGVAFAMGRREQLGLDPVTLRAAFKATTPESVRRARTEVFGPSRRATVWFGGSGR